MDSEIELTVSIPSEVLPSNPDSHLPSQDIVGEDAGFSLPRADGGKDAWLFLIGGFAIEALVWGFPFTFGLFQEYYSSHEPFSSEASSVAIIGTSATGIMYISSLFLMPMYSHWPWLRLTSIYVGLPVMVLGVLAASFANSVWQLILTQGVCYAIGGSLVYCPTILFMDEWFIRRKGLAFGIMWAGTGVAGMILPFIVNVCLEAFGFRTFLRAWSVAIVAILLPLLYVVKPRLPVPSTSQARPLDLRFFASPAFWMLELSNILQSLGYFLPSIYLPTIAQFYGSSSLGATLTLAFQNLAAVFGGLAMGALVDRFHVTSVMMIVAVGSASSVFFIWGFSQSLPLLIAFAILYGLSAGGFSVCWPGVIKEVQKGYVGADTGIMFGLLGTGRGIGAIASGPLSAALIGSSSALHTASFAYGSDYGRLIIFTGATATAGSLGFFARRLGWI